MPPSAPPTIFAGMSEIVTAFTSGAQSIIGLLLQPPISYFILLGIAGWGFNKVRGFIRP